MLYVGEGPRGSNDACCTLHRTSIFHSDTHNQTGPLWCWFPSGWACARSRPLWVSPTTSPVRLGVSPAAAPTPTDVFNQRFEALFPWAGALGCAVCLAPRRSAWFICARMWGRRVCQWSDCLPCLSHTAPVSIPPQQLESSPPAACLRPSYQSGWMFLFYLLGVGLPCRSIFCQFWLWEKAQCVYLRCHLGSPLLFPNVSVTPITHICLWPVNLPEQTEAERWGPPNLYSSLMLSRYGGNIIENKTSW